MAGKKQKWWVVWAYKTPSGAAVVLARAADANGEVYFSH